MTTERTFETGMMLCPCCGAATDRVTNCTGVEKPVPGSLAVCIYCAGVSVYNDDMTRRPLSEEERQALPDGVKRLVATLVSLLYEQNGPAGRRQEYGGNA